MKTQTPFIILVNFMLFMVISPVWAVTKHVPSEYGTIQAAIDDCNDGDTVLVASGTYTGEGNRDIDFNGKAITLKSESGAETCIIDCQASEQDLHRGFYFHNREGNDSVLDGFTITNGCAWHGGGIRCRGSNPTISNCVIRNNRAALAPGMPGDFATNGGGIYCSGSDSLKIIRCYIAKNAATGAGGAIHSSTGESVLFGCVIRGNTASSDGGAISLYDDSMLIQNCVVSGNRATRKFSGGGRISGGGGIYCQDSTPTIVNCTIVGNMAKERGGGMYIRGSNTTISNTVFWNNEANEGPEIFGPASLTISFSNVKGGTERIYIPNNGSVDWETSNIDIDPLFAYPGYWVHADDPNSIVEQYDPNDPNIVWLEGDYHLRSQAGRWDPNSQTWVQDDVTSPCIDAGDPNSPIMHEPFPNGGYVNMGAYGGTSEASKSYFGGPVCETIIAGDINGDCKVDDLDLEILFMHWLEDGRLNDLKIINGVEFKIRTDKTVYHSGEKVQIVFSVTNISDEAIEIVCFQHPVLNLLVQKDGIVVWQGGNYHMQSFKNIELSPGKSVEQTHNWDMRDFSDHLIGPGTYYVGGIMYTYTVGETNTYELDSEDDFYSEVYVPIVIPGVDYSENRK